MALQGKHTSGWILQKPRGRVLPEPSPRGSIKKLILDLVYKQSILLSLVTISVDLGLGDLLYLV